MAERPSLLMSGEGSGPTLSDVEGSGRRVARHRTEHGAAAVEFALVLVPLLVILFGIIQYGFYFWAMQGGADIARDAVRRAAVADPSVTTCTAFKNHVRDQIGGLVGSGKVVKIRRDFVQNPSLPHANATDVAIDDTVKVTVQFKGYDFHFPFVPFIHDGLVTAAAEARVEYVKDQPGLTCT
jgi:Flp pilus assembly protein TadG